MSDLFSIPAPPPRPKTAVEKSKAEARKAKALERKLAGVKNYVDPGGQQALAKIAKANDIKSRNIVIAKTKAGVIINKKDGTPSERSIPITRAALAAKLTKAGISFPDSVPNPKRAKKSPEAIKLSRSAGAKAANIKPWNQRSLIKIAKDNDVAFQRTELMTKKNGSVGERKFFLKLPQIQANLRAAGVSFPTKP